MNNSISDWNLIVPEDKILKIIDDLNKKLDNFKKFQDNLDKLQTKLDKLDKFDKLQDKLYKFDKLQTKFDDFDKLQEKLDKIDEKLEKILNGNNYLDILNVEQQSSLDKSCDLNLSDNFKKSNELNKSDYFNPENYSKNNKNNFIFPYSLIDNMGIKGVINDYSQERIKNKLWRQNVINYKSPNYYTTTPYMKF